MSYSRYGDSHWYTYYSSRSGDTKDSQVMSIDGEDYTYKQLKEDIIQVLDKYKSICTIFEIQELKGYIEEFIKDVEQEFDTAFICICSEEYLAYYKQLYNSLKTHAPQHRQILYFWGQNFPNEYDKVVDLRQLVPGCNLNTELVVTPGYNKLETICSLRARVVLDAFEKGYQKVIFLGAKVEFFKYPRKMINHLDDHSAVVTPHILEPLPEDGLFPANASVSFTGHISTDVIGFRNSPEIIRFLTWQDEIMKTKCKTTAQTYLDQSWLNFLPFFVDNVKVLRDPGYNVAYWCYYERNIPIEDIICFQYSGIDLDHPELISKYQNRHIATEEFLKFLQNYTNRINECYEKKILVKS